MLYTIVRRGCDDDDDVDIGKVLDHAHDVTKMTRKFWLITNIYIADEIKANRGLIMKGKVRSVARVNRMFTTLRYDT